MAVKMSQRIFFSKDYILPLGWMINFNTHHKPAQKDF
jgi:hypothetical protein